MSTASSRGRVGEDYTAGYLADNGWKIVARNFRVRGGEVDIIAEKDNVLAFVEVKTRKFGSYLDGVFAVDKRKQRRIIYTAERWIEKFPADGKYIRFDVASVVVTTEQFPQVIEMEYLDNAFDSLWASL